MTAPLRVTSRLSADDVAAIVNADALVRWARSAVGQADWACPTVAGDLAGQYAVDRELAREGRDRAIVGRDEFAERVRIAEASARERVIGLLADLGAGVDLVGLDGPDVAEAAVTAFVALYEAGLLRFVEHVVDTCPRCLTAVDRADTEAAAVEGDALVLGLETTAGRVVEVLTHAPELIAGAVAIAAPRGHPAVGDVIDLPIAARRVPVVMADVGEPLLVVPAHDGRSLELARRLRLAPIEVLDVTGVVHHDGALDGLSRYAARTAATELLRAEGLVEREVAGTELVGRCRRCRTVLVPRLGRHWVLPTAALEREVADAVREGSVSFFPPAAREDFLAHAGQGGDWCVSYQVVAGQPVPAATCLDCGQLSVSVERQESCPRCTGPLAPDHGVLDAGFVGAVWPLAANGWPAAPRRTWPAATLVIGPKSIDDWALTMAGVGYRLTGQIPFSEIVLAGLDGSGVDGGDHDSTPVDLADLVARHGGPSVRVALLSGTLDLASAAAAVAALAGSGTKNPAGVGPTAMRTLADVCAAAVTAGRPGDALGALVAAAPDVNAAEADRLRALAGPLLGGLAESVFGAAAGADIAGGRDGDPTAGRDGDITAGDAP